MSNNQTKQCSKCEQPKDLSEYGKSPTNKNGLHSWCKECSRIWSRLYDKTKEGVLSKIYRGQKYTSKKRGHHAPSYTKQELREWLFNQPLFHKLYDHWVISGYSKALKPSVDRKNDYKGYSFSNIQLMTWGENLIKESTDMKNGINNKQSKAVEQFTLDGEFVAEYYSLSEAHRVTNAAAGSICSCCKGKRSHAGGFIWKYANPS